MKKYVGVIACLLIICAVCTGCGLTLIAGLTFDANSDVEVVESVAFPNNGSLRVGDDGIHSKETDTQPHVGDGERSTEEKQVSIIVDSGLTVIEVTNQNIYQVNDKYGIATTGVIIIESNNTDELKCGDKVIEVNGQAIVTAEDMDKAFEGLKVGDVALIVVERGEDTVSVELDLKERIPDSVDFG